MKETVAGIVFISIWVLVMVLWGNSKNTQPDMRNYERNQVMGNPCNGGGSGHPLDNCW